MGAEPRAADMAEDDDGVVVTSDGRRIRPVKSVARAVELLDQLGAHGEPMGLTELASAVGCSKTAAYNLVTTLELRGLVRKVADHRYVLGWKMLEWGEVVRLSSTFGEATRARVVSLAESTGETAMLAVLDRDTVMCVEFVESRRSVPISTFRGARQLANAGAPGQALLAFSPMSRRRRIIERLDPGGAEGLAELIGRVRADGFAAVADGAEVAIAVPVFDYTGDAVASVAIVGPRSRLPDDRITELVGVVGEAGASITQALGGADRGRIAFGA